MREVFDGRRIVIKTAAQKPASPLWQLTRSTSPARTVSAIVVVAMLETAEAGLACRHLSRDVAVTGGGVPAATNAAPGLVRSR